MAKARSNSISERSRSCRCRSVRAHRRVATRRGWRPPAPRHWRCGRRQIEPSLALSIAGRRDIVGARHHDRRRPGAHSRARRRRRTAAATRPVERQLQPLAGPHSRTGPAALRKSTLAAVPAGTGWRVSTQQRQGVAGTRGFEIARDQRDRRPIGAQPYAAHAPELSARHLRQGRDPALLLARSARRCRCRD